MSARSSLLELDGEKQIGQIWSDSTDLATEVRKGAQLKITGVESIPFSIPLIKTTEWATGSQSAAEHVLVRIDTDEGIAGIAEAPPRPTHYGESIQSIKYSIDNWFGPMLLGMDPFAIEAVWNKLNSIRRGTCK